MEIYISNNDDALNKYSQLTELFKTPVQRDSNAYSYGSIDGDCLWCGRCSVSCCSFSNCYNRP